MLRVLHFQKSQTATGDAAEAGMGSFLEKCIQIRCRCAAQMDFRALSAAFGPRCAAAAGRGP